MRPAHNTPKLFHDRGVADGRHWSRIRCQGQTGRCVPHATLASSLEGCTAAAKLWIKTVTRECRSRVLGLSPKMRSEVDEKLAPALCALTALPHWKPTSSFCYRGCVRPDPHARAARAQLFHTSAAVQLGGHRGRVTSPFCRPGPGIKARRKRRFPGRRRLSAVPHL